jgi:DNA repair exonuclease SbcCD nuclease subunit
MPTLSILHSADLHLGGPVAAPDQVVAGTAAGAREEALGRLLELSRGRGVQLVLLAGDVFHGPQPPLSAVLALEGAIAAWVQMGAQVFIAPGNHDPWLPGGVWEHWPKTEGLHIFGPEARGIDLPELGLWVAGVGHASQGVKEDLAATLPPPPAGRLGVALLHASLERAIQGTSHQPYAPTSLERLSSGPFALWALGHVHIPQELASSPRVIYAGCPQGAHLNEAGPRGAWLIEIDGSAVGAEFVPLAPLVFYDLAYGDLLQIKTPSQLVERIGQDLPPSQGPWPPRSCLRLRLSGPSPLYELWSREEPAELARALKAQLGVEGLVLEADGLCPPLDPYTLASRPDVLGRLLTLMERAASDDEFLAELEEGLVKGLHPDSQRLSQEQRRARLRELLAEARWLALKGLWQGGDDAL